MGNLLCKKVVFLLGSRLLDDEKNEHMDKFMTKLGMVIMAGLLISVATLSSCRKKGNTVAIVTVLDTGSTPVPGAMVRLYPTPTLTSHGAIVIDDTMYTEIDGTATFDYTDHFNLGSAGFAVLDIEVRLGEGDTVKVGEGIIQIAEEETTEATVIVQ
ncbi:MAG: hypothetical protein MI810_17105 [Flavobacteriales bacterium]|nr:hypothetical protein [Flavobacteriales bacterium]